MSSALVNDGLIINQKYLSGIGEVFIDEILTEALLPVNGNKALF
jgi:formamidopyrimidine-DNA glycosylase